MQLLTHETDLRDGAHGAVCDVSSLKLPITTPGLLYTATVHLYTAALEMHTPAEALISLLRNQYIENNFQQTDL